jgi:hypothetical protein
MWVSKFGLTQYRYHFEFRRLKNSHAEVFCQIPEKVVSVYLNKTQPKNDRRSEEDLAHHEALHILLAKLSWLASCRYVTREEIVDEEEEIVRRLEHERLGID